MKNFFQIREEINLVEMDLLHKKKIASAHQKIKDMHANIAVVAKHHYDQSEAMQKKHGDNHPLSKMHRNVATHLHKAAENIRISDGSKAADHVSRAHNLAKHYSQPGGGHRINNMHDKISKVHKDVTDAHNAHQNAIKNSPTGKLKTLGNKIKSKLTKESVDTNEGSIKGSGTDRKAQLKKAFRAGEQDRRDFNKGKNKGIKFSRTKDTNKDNAYAAGSVSSDGASAKKGADRMKNQDSLSVGRSKLPHKGAKTGPTDRFGVNPKRPGTDLLKRVRFQKIQKPISSDMNSENYVSQEYKNGKKTNVRRVFRDLKSATTHANSQKGEFRVHQEGLGDMIKTGVRTAANSVASAINNRRSTFGTSGGAKSASQMRGEEVGNKKPPFDNAKPINKDPKDKFGNPIKNRAKHLARKAARDLLNKAK